MSSPAQVIKELELAEQGVTDSYRPIVRLDEPCNPSTRLSEQVKLKGWYVAPVDVFFTDLTRRPGLEVLIEPCAVEHPLRHNSSVLGERLSRKRSSTAPFIEYLQLEERRPELPVSADDVCGQLFSVDGSVNIAALIPPDGAPVARYRLTLMLELEQWISVSNSVEIAIPPRSEWGKSYGGFLFPSAGEVATDFLVIRGWGVRLGDQLNSVTLMLNGEELSGVERGVWSPEIHLALPDPEESQNSVFTLTVSRSEMQKRGLNLSAPVKITAKCRFESGEELSFAVPRVVWKPAAASVPSGQHRALCGGLERVLLGAEGRVRLEGWARGVSGVLPTLYLEGARRRIELINSAPDGTTLSWGVRPDLQMRQISWSDGSKCGFVAEFDPALLGRMHGMVVVSAELGGSRVLLGEESWERLTTLVAEGVSIETPIDRAVSSGSVILSKLGLKKSFQRALPMVATGSVAATPGDAALKRILFATHNLSAVEGAPKVVWKLIRYLQEVVAPGIEVLVISARDGEQREQLEETGVRVEVIPALSMVGARFDLYQHGVQQLLTIARGFAPQIVYANVIDCFWGVDAAQRLGIPALWTIHESVPPQQTFSELDPILKTQFLHRFRDASSVLFVSEATRALYESVVSRKVTRVIPNGVDTAEIEAYLSAHDRPLVRESLGIKRGESVVTIVGTTTPRKGQDIFLKEMALLKERISGGKLRFFVVGCREGEFLSHLRVLSKRYRIDKLTTFVDETSDAYRYFLASDVVVVASREESAPLVSLEAFAIGVPLVSTTVFGLAEQVRDGKNALAFSRDAEGQLAAQVERILKNDLLRTELVTEAKRDVAARFALDKSLAQHVAAIRDALLT